MYATAQISGTSTIVPVSDMAATAAFYTDTLDFTLEVGSPAYGYCLLRRGTLMVALVNAADDAALRATANNISAQFWVEDLQALWETWASALADLPVGRVRAPFDQSYGTREFHLKDPDGFLMIFTQMDVAR